MPEHPAQSSDIEQLLPAGFKVAKWLGVGNFGKVCRAKGQGGFECAFKIIEMTRGKAVGLKEFRALRVIRRIKPHRNLIEYLGVWLITSEGVILDNADQIQDEDLQKLDVAELVIQMPLAVKSLEVRLKECRREFKNRTDRQPGDLPGIPLPELLPYMRGVAEALDHLHSPIHPLTDTGFGWIMHRDVKPANILIDRTGNVLVADYGVARAVGADVKSTQSGAGTPIYSAPEQITDKVEVVDPASDQYSLAISYYELRTGMLPFADDTMGDVQSLKLAHTLGKLDFSLLPRNEVSVLKRATNRTVNRRFPSCVEFVDELWKANGVVPMQSGFIQKPKPRVVPDSAADFGLPPPPQPMPPPIDTLDKDKTGSRTPYEVGTAPDYKHANESEPRPTGSKPSGTLSLGDLVRSTPFTPPTPPEEPLPLADEEPGPAPWQAATPVKSKSKSAIDLQPAEPTAAWASTSTTKPKSKTEINLDDSAHPGPASWHSGNTPKKRGLNALLFVVGGVAVAAIVVVAVILGLGPNPGPPPVEPEPPTTGSAGVTPEPGSSGKGLAGTDLAMNGVSSAEKAPVATANPVTAEAKLAEARVHLNKDGLELPAAINSALTLLDAIRTDPVVGKTAVTLHDEWSAVKKSLAIARSSLADAERFDRWAEPESLGENDRAPLRAVYAQLKAKNPTALARLLQVRLLLNCEAPVAALGMPMSILSTAAIGRLNELVALEPPEEIDKPAKALFIAWTAALKLDATFVASREVALTDIEESGRELRKTSVLTVEDRSSLESFHRVRLARLVERFARKPIALNTAKDWDALRGRLPNAKEMPDSPWLELLAVESSLMADALAAKPERPMIALAAPAGSESADLHRYRSLLKAAIDWNNARTPQNRRDAVQPLLDALAASEDWLGVDSRKAAAGAILAAASRDFKQPVSALNSPFATAEQADLAKRTLLRSAELLAVSKDHMELHLQTRRDLLRAAAFPKVDAAAAKAAGLAAKDIDAAGAAERNSLWLAFALTREPGSAEGLAALEKLALAAVEEVKGKADLAPLAAASKQLRSFVTAAPENQKAEAARKLLLPLVTELFPRRASLTADGKTLLSELASEGAKLGKADDLELLHHFVRLELTNEKLEETAVASLHNRVGTARSRALLGLVQLRNARTEPNTAAKVALLELGTGNVEKALDLLKSNDPEKLSVLLNRESVSAWFELGRTYEADARGKPESDAHNRAIAAFDKFVSLAKDRPESAADLRAARLALGRCQWELSNAKDWKERLTAARAALETIKPADDEFPEAATWLALVELYENSLIRHNSAAAFDSEKAKLVTLKSAKKAELDKVLAVLLKVPAGKSPFAIEALEWKACVACARANASNGMTDADRAQLRDRALKDLDELAKADPPCGALRRIQFLAYRAETAVGRNGDPESKRPEIAAMWEPADGLLDKLRMPTTTTRLSGTPAADERVHAACLAMIRLHAFEPADRKEVPATPDLRPYLDWLRKKKSAETVSMIEAIGMKSAQAAVVHRTAERSAAEAASATLAVRFFHFAGTMDPELGFTAEWDRTTLLTVGSYRDYVASAAVLSVKIKADQLKNNPDVLDMLIEADAVFEQAAMLMKRIPSPDKTEKEKLDAATGHLAEMKKIWFEKNLDPAIEAVEKAGDAARAKAWREFRMKRLGKE